MRIISKSLHNWSSFPETTHSEFAMLAGVVGLAPGAFHTLLVTQDGSVWSTGVDSGSQRESLIQVISKGATAAAAGNYYSIVVKKDGSVWTTGKNSRGQFCFFDGSPTSRRTFSVVKVIKGAKAIAAGGCHSIVLTQEGYIWATGWNKFGQLGDKSTSDRTKFIKVISHRTEAVAVAAGDSHSIVLEQDGSVWATGRNSNGQLGDGSKIDKNTFVKVMSGGAAHVAAGGYHSMVIKQDGSVWATGWNEHGQLGDTSETDRISYVQVVSSGAKAVATGSRHSMMLKQDGSVWVTGYNDCGQLGDGSTFTSFFFVQVIGGRATAVAAGAFHSMVLKQDGSVWATGSNKYGQFGDGSTTSQNTYVRLALFSNGTGHKTIICIQIYRDDCAIPLACRITCHASRLACCSPAVHLLPFVLSLPFDHHNSINSGVW